MHILVPDSPEFRALQVPGVDLSFESREQHPVGPFDGVVLWGMPRARREALLKQPGLQWALTLTAGVDSVLPMLPPGLRLYNAHGLHEEAVAQHVVACLLTVARGFPRFRDAQHEHRWAKPGPLWILQGREVVLWGYGHIGRIVEGLLKPFGARVTGLRSGTSPEERDDALARADDLVLLLPLTAETRGIVNAGTLGRLKPGAWLVNVGRGPLVDTAALLAALDAGTLGGAVLDVTDPEPLPPDHPLWAYPNVVITPHIASTTDDLMARGAAYTGRFLAEMAAGREPEGRVEVAKGY